MKKRQWGKSLSPRGSFSTRRGRGEGAREDRKWKKKLAYFELCPRALSPFIFPFVPSPYPPLLTFFFPGTLAGKSQWRWVTLEMLLGRLVWIRAVSWQTGKPRRDAQCLVNRLHVQPTLHAFKLDAESCCESPPLPTFPSSYALVKFPQFWTRDAREFKPRRKKRRKDKTLCMWIMLMLNNKVGFVREREDRTVRARLKFKLELELPVAGRTD